MELYVNIQKQLGNFRLETTFSVGHETMALLGASGSGKSMTLKCIAGIETPDEGEIRLDGRVLFDSKKGINLPPQERRIGYLFQNYALFPNMSVEENIGSGFRGTREDRKKVTAELIKTYYLNGLEKKKPRQLSGGQQQRVAIARMLASRPEIILLDEPYSALDSYLRWQLEKEMLELIEGAQKPTLVVSHSLDECYRLSDVIGVIEHGKLIETRNKKELFLHPRTLSVAKLTGCKNYSKIKVLGDHRIKALDWGIDLTLKELNPKEADHVCIRAHHIEVVEATDESLPENQFDVHILRVIEGAFTVMVIYRIKKNESVEVDSFYGNINEMTLELERTQWEKLQGKPFRIALNPESLFTVISS